MSIRIDGTNTTANPGITGSDTDTGLQFGTNEVKVVTDGSDRVTVDSAGNVGIATSSIASGGSNTTNFNVHTPSSTSVYLKLSNSGTGNTASDAFDLSADSSGNAYLINRENGNMTFWTNATERMRIASDGKVGIGHTTPQFGLTLGQTANDTGKIGWEDGSENKRASITCSSSSDALQFHVGTSDTERMRITSGGTLIIGGTDSALATVGSSFTAAGSADHTRDGGNVVYINRLNNDGNLIQFYGDTNYEGSISISGSTISYNGGHLTRWSQLAGGAERTEILRGSVLSNLDEMCEWAYEAQDAVLYTEEDELPEGVSVGDVKTPAVAAGTEDNEQLNRMKISDVEGDVNVAGVFQAWDDDDDNYTNDFYCAMTGDFVIRIAQGTTVARGDLLMSAGDGTAKPQGDDIVRSKTIAKVTSTTVSTTYSDGSYCVPCVLMAC